nr:THAP domain-containing protein 1-like isoform X2 [Pelodiscus sinensis]|eukprot:XP_025046151.1 THAP domain-containing protein 1-like isoform X2 [Pelodiscus sinensis]
MVKYCAAYNCSNADTKLNWKQGITFHRFPKANKKKQQWAQAVQRADLVSGKLWTPSEWDMICSLHFNPECFKETNGKKFLKEWSCPSIFSFPDNFQKTANNPTRLTENFSCSPEVDNRRDVQYTGHRNGTQHLIILKPELKLQRNARTAWGAGSRV